MPEKESGLPCIDIREDDLLALSAEVLATLLRDHTTGRNIFWATHDYEALGTMYDYHSQILPELITGEHGMVIRPRVLKSKEQQSDRVKDMAEVFTPSWVVKKCTVATEMLTTLIIHLKKHTIMNKTWKTILTFIELVISFLLARDKGQKTEKKS